MSTDSTNNRRITEIINESLAVEYEDAKSAGMLGYMARALVQATLPHSDPKTHYFERTNGLVTLSIVGRPKIGLPYGSIPRVLTAWICTEAVRTKDKDLMLGRSQAEFMSKLQMQNDGRYIASLKNQAHRLFSSLISLTGEQGDDLGLENVVIAKRAFLFWNPRKPDEPNLWESTLTLTQDFYDEVTRSPVPIDLRVLHALRQSPLAMDIYTWLTYRVFLLRVRGRPEVIIPWQALKAQFGSAYGKEIEGDNLTEQERKKVEGQALRNFKMKFLKRLKEVLLFYPEAKDAISDDPSGLRIQATRLHIKRDEKNPARLAPPPGA
ncbi:replication protein RepA [Paraburkholderia sp. A1RO-5L]|uniref:replication protein RepA n=1 Tax=Paraburkholderia sp. A1RO-5L TaxID=3028370 RepID=UPI003B772132